MTFISVVTGTTGNILHLKKCIESVQAQTYTKVEHIIVVDGPEFERSTRLVLEKFQTPKIPIKVLVLPHNTGKNNWYGHRIYGSMTFIVNTPWVMFLDEDNFIAIDHIQSVYDLTSNNDLDWCWCKRNIVNKKGEFLVQDNCESLGDENPAFFTINRNPFNFIDSNCWIWKVEFLMKIVNFWYNKGYQNPPNDPDKLFSTYLINKKLTEKFKCTNKYTLNYTVEESRLQFFIDGNNFMKTFVK